MNSAKETSWQRLSGQKLGRKLTAKLSSTIWILILQASLSLPLISQAAEVSSFSPAGTVKAVRQVRASFSEAMVALGDSNANPDPFDMSCGAFSFKPEQGVGQGQSSLGKGRWADAKNWVYDFDNDLPGGIQCTFNLKSGLKTLSGEAVTGRSFSFDTGGPNITRSEPWEGGEIDEEQIFILSLDAKADPKSVVEHAYFEVQGISEKIPVKIIDRDPRKEFEESAKGFAGKMKAKLKKWASRFGLPASRTEVKPDATPQVILQAQRRFPPSAKLTLVWSGGVATPNGAKTKTDQTLAFLVRGDFSVEFNCDRENAQAPCIPISAMSLNFSADVPWKEIKKIRLKSEKGQEWKPSTPQSESKQDDAGVRYVTFKGPFPESTQFEVILPKNLQDDAGRVLSNASRFPLTVTTSDFPPLIKFPSSFGILESKPEAVLPVTARNVESDLKVIQGKFARLDESQFAKVIGWLSKITEREYDREKRGTSFLGSSPELKTETITLPKPNGDRAFEVLGIPLKGAGLYMVEFESPRLGRALLEKQGPMYVPAIALVTNISVHFKQGRESSLIWVTSLDQAQPLEGVNVSVRNCTGATVATGRTDAQGMVHLDKEFAKGEEVRCTKQYGYSQYASGLYVTAEKDGDFSFVHSSWQKGIQPWRYNLPSSYALSPEYASTVFDRTLFRAGESVHMKHFLRKHSIRGIGSPESGGLPKTAQITHQDSNQSYELPLSWRANAVSESTWVIPKGAKLGTYSVLLKNGKGSESYSSGDFRVEEYRVPLMKGQVKPPVGDLIQSKDFPVDLAVEYLSGGAASKLPVQVRYQTSGASPMEFPEFDGYLFGTGKVKDPKKEDSEDTSSSAAERMNLVLDQAGLGRVKIPVSPKFPDQIKNVHVELDYKDPNGETQTVGRTVVLYPSSRVVGVKPSSWAGTKKSLKFQVAVTDLRGHAIKNAPVTVDFVEQKHYSHRKRLVGGLYAYENKSEIKRHGKACSGNTDDKGLLECDSKPPVAGNLILEARTSDDSGRLAYSYSSTWVYDSSGSWFAQEDSDRIDLLPERKRYEAGEKAVFQVRMPFREATALVTVEREGVLDSFVVPVSGAKPLIEIPVKPEYSPNVFVSALVVRGRVGDVQPTAMIDLGKPAYKLGIGEINVGWTPHELSVRITPTKEVYQVRENGSFKIQVKTADGKPLPKGSEVAFAAVDQGLLQLKANNSWNLLDAMMRRRGYEVETFTAQSEVIGKRHFGLKALATGGDGGRAPAREIFDSLLYWNGNVVLDSNGEAEVHFPMNDSITGFKLVAVAHAGKSLFGTGYASIRTTQDLMILSGVPQLAREGDHLPLQFTLRNTTGKPMTVIVSGKAQGLPDLPSREIVLAPNEAKQVSWNVDVPAGAQLIKYQLVAKEKDGGGASDQVQVSQKVIPAIPVKVLQATLGQVESEYQLPVEKPKDAVAASGSVRVILDASLLTGLNGVREYMQKYPYSCLEQRVSKAVVTRDKKLWQTVLDDLPSYLDADGLAKFFPSDWIRGSDVLTAYLLSVSNEAGWEFPEDVKSRMLQGLKGFIEGRLVRTSEVPTADLTIRKLSALEAISRYGEAKWAMTGSFQVAPNLWPTSAVIDWADLLKRVKDAPNVEAQRKQADQILRSRLNFQGTVMTFSTDNIDQLWWMMVSTSVNVNRFLLSIMDDPSWKDDMGKITRGSIQRQQQGHWDSTPANAWGGLAVEKFAQNFEKSPVTGATRMSLPEAPSDPRESTLNWPSSSASPSNKTFDFTWPNGPATLTVSHSGEGKPWITVQSRAAVPLKEPISSGYKIKKTLTPVEQKTSSGWSRGDILRVRLEMESQSDMSWVVVNDPIPAGAVILGSGLGNDSGISTGNEKTEGWVQPAFQERAFDGYRAYYQYVPKGKWVTEYTVRFNQSGQMNLPPTRVEAMYAPEMFGEVPNDSVSISE